MGIFLAICRLENYSREIPRIFQKITGLRVLHVDVGAAGAAGAKLAARRHGYVRDAFFAFLGRAKPKFGPARAFGPHLDVGRRAGAAGEEKAPLRLVYVRAANLYFTPELSGWSSKAAFWK